MKAVITDEYDEGGSIIDGPEEIITNLNEYLLKFDKYQHKMCWGTEEFINYLNDVILIYNDKKVKIVELWTRDYDNNLPKLQI